MYKPFLKKNYDVVILVGGKGSRIKKFLKSNIFIVNLYIYNHIIIGFVNLYIYCRFIVNIVYRYVNYHNDFN